MRIFCVGYRDWALNIYDELSKKTDHHYCIVRSQSQYDESLLFDFKPDLVLYYGWSWMVSENILNKFTCLMLHPSALPKFRGGSPIQNQIIAGEKKSKVTIFVMNNKLDSGDIVASREYSLEGSLKDIFNQIQDIGLELSLKIIGGPMNRAPQNEKDATYCKRLSPTLSEITLDELQIMSAEYLYNKIRMLEDPYPNAYFKTSDGRKLFIKSASIDDQ